MTIKRKLPIFQKTVSQGTLPPKKEEPSTKPPVLLNKNFTAYLQQLPEKKLNATSVSSRKWGASTARDTVLKESSADETAMDVLNRAPYSRFNDRNL